jgi:hypothetical protein
VSGLSLLKRLLKYFSDNKNEIVYSAFNNDDYFKALDKVKSQGIKFKVKNLINHSSSPNPVQSRDHKTPVHFEFYVKKMTTQKLTRQFTVNKKRCIGKAKCLFFFI